MSFRSIQSNETSESTHIGRKQMFKRKEKNFSFLDNPSARVQFLLGDEDQDDDDEEHKPHDLFIELDELVTTGGKGNETSDMVGHGWKETARLIIIIKFISFDLYFLLDGSNSKKMSKQVVDGVNLMSRHYLFIPYWNYGISFREEVSFSICMPINYQPSLVREPNDWKYLD